MRTPTLSAAMAAMAAMALHQSAAFVVPSGRSKARIASPITPSPNAPSAAEAGSYRAPLAPAPDRRRRATAPLPMGFQLPPSGPKGPMEQLEEVLPAVGTVVLVALFFASPLGGLFFALFNSLFVLAFLAPFILYAGFQIWTALYTVEAPCPGCEAFPVRVLKEGEPSVCLKCGAYCRATVDGDGVELCNNPYGPGGLGGERSMFDSLFGMGGSGFSNYDVMNVGPEREGGREERAESAKRRGTIIDVDVERD